MISGVMALDKVLGGRTAEPLSSPAAGAANATAQTSFADALAGLATETVGKLDQAEQVSLKALQGEADIRQVVDAVMSAEQSLQAAIAIRDKIVTAYLEISRMAI